MSWTSPPERVLAPPPQPELVTEWRPRGPAVTRTLAVTVLGPGLLLLVGSTQARDIDDESVRDGVSAGGFWLGALVALAVLAVLLWCLVAQARTRPPRVTGTRPGNGTQIAAVLVFALSVVYLVVVPLAIVVFLLATVLVGLAGLVAVPAAVGALVGLINARGGHCGPTQLTATCAATAGWAVATIGMPVAGGIFVLQLAGA